MKVKIVVTENTEEEYVYGVNFEAENTRGAKLKLNFCDCTECPEDASFGRCFE